MIWLLESRSSRCCAVCLPLAAHQPFLARRSAAAFEKKVHAQSGETSSCRTKRCCRTWWWKQGSDHGESPNSGGQTGIRPNACRERATVVFDARARRSQPSSFSVHDLSRAHKHSMLLISAQVFVERVRAAAAAELLGGWQIRGRPPPLRCDFGCPSYCFQQFDIMFPDDYNTVPPKVLPCYNVSRFLVPLCYSLSARVQASRPIHMPFHSCHRSNLPPKHDLSSTPTSYFMVQLFTPLLLMLRLPLPPHAPLQMRCLTRIFHPNIDDTTGKICASFLDDTKWVPTHTILSMLQSMYVVMFQGTAFACRSCVT